MRGLCSMWPQGGGTPDPERLGCYKVDVAGLTGVVQEWYDDTSGTRWYATFDDPYGVVDIIDNNTAIFADLDAVIAPVRGMTPDAMAPGVVVVDCADALVGCGQRVALGQPDVVGDPLLWVDAGDRGTIFDASGDPTPTNVSAGTGPGFNFGLPAWSGAFSGQVRTTFDKSGNDFHLMVPPGSTNPERVQYVDGQTAPLEPWERATYIQMLDTGGRHLLHVLDNPIVSTNPASGNANFDLWMVVRADDLPDKWGSLFASTANIVGAGTYTTLGSFQVSRNSATTDLAYVWARNANNATTPINAFPWNLLLNQWHTLRVSHQNGVIRVYLDGVQMTAGTVTRITFLALSLAMNRAAASGMPSSYAEVVLFDGDPLDVNAAEAFNAYLECKWLHGKMA